MSERPGQAIGTVAVVIISMAIVIVLAVGGVLLLGGVWFLSASSPQAPQVVSSGQSMTFPAIDESVDRRIVLDINGRTYIDGRPYSDKQLRKYLEDLQASGGVRTRLVIDPTCTLERRAEVAQLIEEVTGVPPMEETAFDTITIEEPALELDLAVPSVTPESDDVAAP